MPSDSSHALVRQGFFGWLAPSSPKKSSSNTPKPQIRDPAPDDVYHEENKAVWKEVKGRNGNESTLICAIVSSDQKKPMRKLMDEKKKGGKLQSTVVVTTQSHLQDVMDAIVGTRFKTLYLLVSSTVDYLTYNIAGVFKTVYWDRRTDSKLLKKRITYAEGCVIDIQDNLEDARRVLNEPIVQPNLSEAKKAEIKRQFDGFREDVIDGSRGAAVSSDTESNSAPGAYETETWFQRWKGLLATIVGAGAGAFGVFGSFWVSAGGVCIKGPFGMSIAAGYFTAAGVGGACAAGGVVGLAAGGAVYFVPWDRFWASLKNRLWELWEYIRDTFVWIWNKLKGLAGF
ncbi:hypothetical protein LCI18_012695 [Fusarium solani-melongenae]|uniref:Uncharacterized protein n=1 Tax=Fusarium solani subsp. cucurbitae TaxID=2747967 RepID=A0ACD3ZKM5_FUSSC|nr:hypothetical protein LCI18_012695 [Fusarium solani-melongenae]